MEYSASLLGSALRPLLAPIIAFVLLGALWLLWKWVPEGKIKRLMFFNLWGGKDDPWVKAYRPKQEDEYIGRIDPELPTALPQEQAEELDPESRPSGQKQLQPPHRSE